MDAAVVDDPAIAGAKLDAADRHVAIQGEGDGEGPIEVVSFGRSSRGSGIVSTRSGWPSDQLSENLGAEAGRPGRLARSRSRPIGRGSPSRSTDRRGASMKTPAPGLRLPRRHLAGLGHLADEAGAFGRVPVGSKENGPTSPGRWHFAQFFQRIGATCLLKVIVSTESALGDLGMSRVPQGDRVVTTGSSSARIASSASFSSCRPAAPEVLVSPQNDRRSGRGRAPVRQEAGRPPRA